MAYELCSPALIDTVVSRRLLIIVSPMPDFRRYGHDITSPNGRFLRNGTDVIKFYRSHLDLNFVWGVSLNFVPHITTGVENVRWHRTPKSAVTDLGRSGFGKNPTETVAGRFGRHKERRIFGRSAELTRRTEMLQVLKRPSTYFDRSRTWFS